MLISNFYFPSIFQPPCRCTFSSSIVTRISPIPTSLKVHNQKLSRTFVTGSSSPATPSQDLDVEEEKRSKLKEQLLYTIAASNGILNEHSMALISSLGNINPNPDITIAPHLLTGCFEQISSTLKGTGKPGEAHKLVENTVTLGRATFNAFSPTDTEIQMKQTYNHVGVEADDAYYLLLKFSVNCPYEGADAPPMEGMLINKASFSVSDFNRIDIIFESSSMVPLNPQKDLQSWLKLFRDHNPSMDEKGVVKVALPPAKGFHDYLYLDHELRITKGNRGTINVVKRLPQKVIHL
ncbi:hypothetical protein SUGI_0171830 [Cryptomeria japonica]|uniref:uncharacterized protein LOC131047281 n=1 Tax=Cryptomeria japonica TaxID=3369 RepID=UPI00240892AB|nr:uncharacterized protein LOC131047281 [Cryptomeria japonica]GLJ11578.1 hypothetical protein SUGI_0171830 [Cryptomeria japonica]